MSDNVEIALYIRAKEEASAMLRELNANLATNRKAWQDNYAEVSRLATQAGIAFTAAGAAITGALALTVKAAAEEEAGITRLAQVMDNMDISYEENRESLEAWIDAQLQSTAIADSDQREALATLITMTGNLAEAQDLLTVAMNISAGTGKDLSSATTIIGYALADNWGMINRLIPAVADLETEEEKWAFLREKYAEQAEAYGQSFEGQMKLMKENISDISEAIGSTLIPTLTDVFNELQPVVQEFKAWAQANPETVKTLAEVAGAVGLGTTAIGGTLLVLPHLISGIKAVQTAYKAYTVWAGTATGATWSFYSSLVAIPAIAFAAAEAISKISGNTALMNSVGQQTLGQKVVSWVANLLGLSDVLDAINDEQGTWIATIDTATSKVYLYTEEEIKQYEAMGYHVTRVREATEALARFRIENEELAEAAEKLIADWQSQNSEAGKLGVSMEEIYDYLLDQGVAIEVVEALYKKYGTDTKNLTALLESHGITVEEVAQSYGTLGDETAQFLESLKKLKDAYDESQTAVGQLGISLEDVENYLLAQGATVEQLKEYYKQFGASAQTWVDALKIDIQDLSYAYGDLGTQMAADLQAAYDELKELAEQATQAQIDAIDDQLEAEAERHQTILDNLQEEYEQTLATIDAELEATIAGCNGQIDAIDAALQAIEDAKTSRENAKKKASLEEEIAAATSTKKRLELEQELNDLIVDSGDETWQAQRQAALEAEIAAEADADIRKALQEQLAEYETEIAEAKKEAELEAERDSLEEEIEAAKNAAEAKKEAARAEYEAEREIAQQKHDDLVADLKEKQKQLQDDLADTLEKYQTDLTNFQNMLNDKKTAWETFRDEFNEIMASLTTEVTVYINKVITTTEVGGGSGSEEGGEGGDEEGGESGNEEGGGGSDSGDFSDMTNYYYNLMLNHYAKGGIAWNPQIASLAEDEPELIAPFSKIPELLGVGGGSAPVYVTVPVYVGDEKVAEKVLEIIGDKVKLQGR